MPGVGTVYTPVVTLYALFTSVRTVSYKTAVPAGTSWCCLRLTENADSLAPSESETQVACGTAVSINTKPVEMKSKFQSCYSVEPERIE